MDIEFVRSRFIKHFDGKTGNIYQSPGRINLIGEHTDYNGGFVFPGAVDKGIMAELRPNGTNTIMCYSIDLKDRVEFKVDDPQGPRASWARYIYGVVQEMRKLGVDVKGFNTAFAGDVPLGAGMSSSAALESCFAFALNDLFGDNKVSKWDMEVYTTEPGVQVYTDNWADGYKGQNGATFPRRSAICFEAQHFPDSPNRPYFPSVVLNPGEEYTQKTIYKFGVSL